MATPEEFVLALDQGTSSTKAMLVDRRGRVRRSASCPVGQTHPRPGWVEQSTDEIWASLARVVRDCVTGDVRGAVVGVALSVQRESITMWDTATGESVGPVLSWQDQRTAAAADELERKGLADYVFATTGLPLDPMFSALKARWLLDEFDPTRAMTGSGRWRLGTLDAWLLSRFGGPAVTEVGNASRTQLLDVRTGRWDRELLAIFGVPAAALPAVVASTGPFPGVRGLDPLPAGLPVLAVLADSHAALFAHAGWRPGVVKATYGSGSSVMALGRATVGATGVCSTIAWDVDGIAPAVEANIRSTGRTMSWLADLLGADVEELWAEAETSCSDGTFVVPAFGGLGAPRWDRNATAMVAGLSLGTKRPQLVRAVLESIAHQVDDCLVAFEETIGPLRTLECDGGVTASTALVQLQADLSGLPVHVAGTANLSALGAAHLAGLRAGWWTSTQLEEGLAGCGPGRGGTTSLPTIDDTARMARRRAWAEAVLRSRSSTGVPPRRPVPHS